MHEQAGGLSLQSIIQLRILLQAAIRPALLPARALVFGFLKSSRIVRRVAQKERFRNIPVLYGFSRAWALRNGVALLIRLATPLCKTDW